MVNDFLFEIGCEELPSGAVRVLADALLANILTGLDKAQITYTAAQSYGTPRRLAVLITGLNNEQPTQQVVRRGPAIHAAYNDQQQPTPALLGFAKSCGIAVEELTVSKTDKGEWLIYETRMNGAKTCELMPTIIQQALMTLPIAKPMRWGAGDAEFARPVHWSVMLFGNEILSCEIFGVQTDRYTYGHRFHAPQAIRIDNPLHYESLLNDAYVMADFTKRRALIAQQITQVAANYQAQAVMPEELLDEVTAIVEWPEALVANFEKEFLDVPAEALIAAMQIHQKCFALRDKNEKLLPHFVTVTNIRSTNPQQVIAGNEKVMRARLSDAAFFFQQDKKHPLSQHIVATAKVVFQLRLGSLLDKTNRVQVLINYLIAPLQLEKFQAIRAVELAKCDLMTGMVGEFPELQGLMGYYYALADGEASAVATALYEQYLPRFAGDELPKTSLGMALSLADRLDTLVGIFAIGQKPSGVKDPFKLRRHALAVVRLLVACPAQLDLSQLIAETVAIYSKQGVDTTTVIAELQPFILERLQSYYQAQDYGNDLVQAVRARQDNWLFDFDKRIKALAKFVTLPEAAALSAACKRVNNLLQQREEHLSRVIDKALLVEPAEKMLNKELTNIVTEILPLYAQGDYVAILTKLARLRAPIDAFFESVMVMVEDQQLKANRLALLFCLQDVLQGVADISVLQLTL